MVSSPASERRASRGEPADLVGLLAVVVAGLLPVVFVDDLYWGGWAPKAALCLAVLLPGLVVLARLVVDGNRPAIAAAAFLAAAGLSTALSDKPALSLTGAANWGTGLLLLATLVGAWALGTFAGARRRAQLTVALIAAVTVNAGVAWTQARVGDGGRTGGLMGNPVFLGGLVAGGLYLLGQRFGRGRRSWWWLSAVAVMAGAAQLSGGRAAVVLAGAAALASLRGAGAARGASLVAALVAGVALAPLGAKAPLLASERVAQASVASTSETRFAVWRVGAGAVRERPLLGFGPGRFAAATARHYDAAAAREGVVLKDAHNWVVEIGVTTGLLGLVLLAAWLGPAGWRARGPLAGFALVTGVSSLVEPLHVALTPLAMLALGAAGAAGPGREGGRDGDGRPLGPRWGAAALVGLGVGLAAAALLVVGQVHLQRGVQRDSVRDAGRGIALSPPWPEAELVAAGVEASLGLRKGEPHRRRTLERTRRAVARDPVDPALWAELGAVELAWGDDERAAEAFRLGLDANPWDLSSLLGRVTLARRRGDQALLADSCRRLRALHRVPPGCDPASGPDGTDKVAPSRRAGRSS